MQAEQGKQSINHHAGQNKGRFKFAKAFLVLALALGLIGSLAACQGQTTKNIKAGVAAGPYGDMVKEAIKPELEAKGYKVEIIEFSDYVQPNTALADKEIDFNLFQHSLYLKKFSAQHNLKLSQVTEVPTAGMGLFSAKHKKLDDLPNEGLVAIPNDDTNLARALRVLEQSKLIKLDPAVDAATVTVKNISENPKGLKFKEISAEILPSVLDSCDVAVVNGNYALASGLKLADALHNEVLGEGYFNIVAVRSEDKDSALAKELYSIVHSDKFRKIIEDPKNLYVAFARPNAYAE